MLKLYWPRITNGLAEENNTLGKFQLGTRKKPADSAMINEFILNMSRIQQLTIKVQLKDSSACYDRTIAKKNHTIVKEKERQRRCANFLQIPLTPPDTIPKYH